MEDFQMDIIVGQGPTARSVQMPVPKFTLIGATTRLSLLSSPLLSRFGIQERMEFYENKDLKKILQRSSTILNYNISSEGALALAARSRGTPRTANRLLKRVWDFTQVSGGEEIKPENVSYACERMEIDSHGLEPIDRRILLVIRDRYKGGPVGLDTLSSFYRRRQNHFGRGL